MIKLLDCTLRDGGYINDWNFGQEAIIDIKNELEKSNTEIIELGFLRDEDTNPDRSIFTSIAEVKSLIKQKLPNQEYAVMTEVSNPYPLELLEPYSEGAPEIIRVIVWKRMLKEGYEYCKGIVEKGYKLCVQPARVSQYSDEEFVDMLNLFSQLNPYAIYVVDSWGTMYKDELLHYLNLANSNLKSEIAVGYHGHNNLMQAFEVACSFCEQNLARDLIIDSSVYGIGRGAGNLNSELIAKWMNEKINKNYNLDTFTKIFDKYISKIYLQEKWGYSVPFEITAKYNCNPNYADYFVKKCCPEMQIEDFIKNINPNERIIFNEQLAENLIKNYFNKKMCIIVPTANKPYEIFYFIRNIAKTIKEYNIDVIIFDSSKDKKIKAIVNEYNNKGFTNVKYDFYDNSKEKASIDKKVINAYLKYSSKYDYIWMTRDGLGINLDCVLKGISSHLYNNLDMIIVDYIVRDYKKIGNKYYNNPTELFKDWCHQMTVLGSVIIKSEAIKNIIDTIPLNENNFGMYQPIAEFQYYADKKLNAASWVGDLWKLYPKGKKTSSFWHKNTLWQWGERWYKQISSLPSVYDEYKPSILKFELIDCKPFSLSFLARVRKLGGLNFATINNYKQYLLFVCNTPLKYFYILACIPKFAVKRLIRIYLQIRLKKRRKLRMKVLTKKWSNLNEANI